MNESQQRPLRPIKSFVLRTGRMTQAQKNAYEDLWPKYGLSSQQGLLAEQAKPVVLEIGFGMGESLVMMAKQQPQQHFIGIEVHRPGVGRILRRIEEEQLDNLQVYAEDALEVLKHSIAANRLSKVQIFFPDPWHKSKHHKRRIIQPDFIQLLREKLVIGGQIHLATDWQHYAEHMLEVMQAAQGFSNLSPQGGFIERPDYRPLTKFEQRGQRLGHGVWDLLFEKSA